MDHSQSSISTFWLQLFWHLVMWLLNILFRVTLQDQFAAFHDLELAFKLEEDELLEKELAEMEEKNQKKSLFQSLEHTDGSIEVCEACKKFEESAKFRAKFKKIKEQKSRGRNAKGKVSKWRQCAIQGSADRPRLRTVRDSGSVSLCFLLYKSIRLVYYYA